MKQVIFYFIIFFSSLSIINAQTADATSTKKEDAEELPDLRCDYSFGLFDGIDFDCKNTDEIKQEGQSKTKDYHLIRNLEVIEITLKKKESELKAQQALLKKKEKEIRGIELRIERKIDELRTLLIKDETERRKIEKLNQAKFESLVEFYSKSEADRASLFMNNLNVETASNLLVRLNPRNAAAIFEGLDPDKAAAITNHISKLQISKTDQKKNKDEDEENN